MGETEEETKQEFGVQEDVQIKGREEMSLLDAVITMGKMADGKQQEKIKYHQKL